MDAFTNSLELTRLVFLTGAILATLYKRKTGITPGGIIAPAFLALALDKSFIWFGALMVIALLTRLIYRQLLESFALPRTKEVLVNIAISTLLVTFAQLTFSRRLPYVEVVAYGSVIPGLIASNSRTYGTGLVVYGTLIVTAITSILGHVYAMVVPYQVATRLSVQLSQYSPLVIPRHYIASIASLCVTFLIITLFNVRAGGYVIAPVLLTLFLSSTLQFALYGLAVAICYGVVRVILRHSLIIGLERFLLCLLLSAVSVTCIDLLAVRFQFSDYLVLPAIYMTAMAVILNDLCLHNFQKVIAMTRRYAALAHGTLNRARIV